jgi:hypothetical protein
MGYCSKCGTKIDDNMLYCPKCGTQIAKMQPIHQPKTRKPMNQTRIYLLVGLFIAIIIVASIFISLIGFGLLDNTSFRIGSGHLETHSYNFSDFKSIEISSGFNIQITQSNNYSINVTADDNLFDYILVDATGDTLSIKLRPGMGFQNTALKAEIEMPNLQTFQAAGGVISNIKNFVLDKDLTIDVSGGSRITMTGQANNITVIEAGGSNSDLSDFKVHNVQVDFSGGSQGTVNLDGKLDATLSGGSRLNYKGNPTMGIIDTSGGSSIAKIS